ncbi:hypothetical protein D3822_32295 [Escherichia coli]|nr:hypothetical protein D3822_32295 [Escherichia coli]
MPVNPRCRPACGGELSSLGCDVSEQLELISSAFKVIETQRPKQACLDVVFRLRERLVSHRDQQ